MSSPFPSPGGNPFEMLFSQLGRMFSSEGPVNWDMAKQFAAWSAAEGQEQGNVQPKERIRLEELIRVADLHVADITGLPTSTTGRVVEVRAVNRTEWALASLEAWKPLLQSLSTSLGGSPAEPTSPGADDADSAVPGLSQMLGPLLPGLQAAFLGLQCGSMMGSVAQRSLGQYDLPIPRPASDQLLVVAENVSAFSADWSLPADDVRLWVCLSDVAHHAVLGRTHVRAALEDLLSSYVGAFDPGQSSLEDRLSGVDPMDPESIQAALGDPAALLGEIETEEQRRLRPRLEALVSVVEGYVDHVIDIAGHRLIASYGPLTEALRRRRLERGEGERMVERLLGVELRQGQYEAGTAFVSGVLDRAGETALSRLWTQSHALPTPSEVAAPGLWLERIDLPGPPPDPGR
jgi:putative hydrolase